MQYTLFGNTGMNVSRFCLGAMTLGGRLDAAASAQVVDEAIDNGVNFIDTADSYGDSEDVLGQVLTPEKRDRIFLATKVFRRFCRDEGAGRNSRVNIISSLERSLSLMKTDYVDLYQLHHPDEETPVQETLSTLDNLVKQGKIRYVGVSNHYAWQMAHMLGESKVNGWEPIVSYQAHYSILDRQTEAEATAFCRRFDIAMMCYSPLCGGVLTGKYDDPENVPEGSRADTLGYLKPYLVDETVHKILSELREIAKEQDLQMNQLAILWLLAKPEATTIILGGTRPEHFTQIYDVADRELPAEVVERIDEISAPRVYGPYMNQSNRNGGRLALNR